MSKLSSFFDTKSICICSSLPLNETKHKHSQKPSNNVIHHYKFTDVSSLKLSSSSSSRQCFAVMGIDKKKSSSSPSSACGATTSQPGSVSELEAESMIRAEEAEELRKLGDKCCERSGIVELLECLEREAIMGDDQGREPTDYNRRAQIFDKSSRVFQALKQLDNANGTGQNQS